jgi:toxin ParE1/3/4
MKKALIVSSRARHQIEKAVEWYDDQQDGLGDQLLDQIQVVFESIEQFPGSHSEIRSGIRRALVTEFQFSVFYVVREKVITVIAVIHHARDPRKWPK